MAARPETDQAAEKIALIPEDVALLADGTGNIPDDTATRLQTFIRCRDRELIECTWRWIGSQLEEQRQMAEDAGVELLADGLYVSRCFERLRADPSTRPSEVLDPRLDVPYQELISMAGALADRGDAAEKVEMQQLIKRLGVALGEQIQTEEELEPIAPTTSEIAEIANSTTVQPRNCSWICSSASTISPATFLISKSSTRRCWRHRRFLRKAVAPLMADGPPAIPSSTWFSVPDEAEADKGSDETRRG